MLQNLEVEGDRRAQRVCTRRLGDLEAVTERVFKPRHSYDAKVVAQPLLVHLWATSLLSVLPRDVATHRQCERRSVERKGGSERVRPVGGAPRRNALRCGGARVESLRDLYARSFKASRSGVLRVAAAARYRLA